VAASGGRATIEGVNEELTTAKGTYQRKAEVQILDVREPFEWQAGHIEGAVHVPLSQVLAGQVELDQSRPVVAICRMGNRSEVAALMLRARGYEAYNLEGGMEDWEKEGLPFVSEDDGPPRVA
jgi:rhodanese-related sulfurtransferase